MNYHIQALLSTPPVNSFHLRLPLFLGSQVYKVETAGDCYIVAGALMQKDEDGFLSLDNEEDAGKGAEKVMAFSKVGKPIDSQPADCQPAGPLFSLNFGSLRFLTGRPAPYPLCVCPTGPSALLQNHFHAP